MKEFWPKYYDEEDEELRLNNFHLSQNRNRIEICDSVNRTLNEDAPTKEYYERKNELRTTNHWGQRKLLLSEIEFLTEYGHKSSLVVYAGAAPGVKNEYLTYLFPEHEFIFIDPMPFRDNLIAASKENDRITLKEEFFTDKIAMEYCEKNVLFICDIRTADIKIMGLEEVEDAIVEDNKMQLSWHLIMKPAASMLKFRLPWGKGITRYLSGYSEEGKIYFPVWGRQSTTETRLVAVGDDVYDYDNTKYAEQLFYFNTITRCNYYKHDIYGVPGLCHCYDCSSEVLILTNYAKKFPQYWFINDDEDSNTNPSTEDINNWVRNTCLQLNEECAASGNRDLTIQIGNTQNWFPPKVFDQKNGIVTEFDVKLDPTIDLYGGREARGYEDNKDILGKRSTMYNIDSPPKKKLKDQNGEEQEATEE